jgi:hypothetical protein
MVNPAIAPRTRIWVELIESGNPFVGCKGHLTAPERDYSGEPAK